MPIEHAGDVDVLVPFTFDFLFIQLSLGDDAVEFELGRSCLPSQSRSVAHLDAQDFLLRRVFNLGDQLLMVRRIRLVFRALFDVLSVIIVVVRAKKSFRGRQAVRVGVVIPRTPIQTCSNFLLFYND